MKSTTKCVHPACNCAPVEGTKHCSAACADATGLSRLTCQCQHQDRQSKQTQVVVDEFSFLGPSEPSFFGQLIRLIEQDKGKP